MGKKKSSSRAWLKEHHDDVYVQRAQKEGYRSRAVYKLLEINDKDRVIRRGMSVLDLGSAPGGWSQLAGEIVGDTGRVVATDILSMDALPDVVFVQGDFTEQETYDQVLEALGNQPLDAVLSDMAPNMSGLTEVDQPRAMYLVELATELAERSLAPGGTFIAKVFQGEGFEAWFREIRGRFDRVVTRKPSASRPRSREVYVVASGFKGDV
jgi:23S rRNA (uridine2552-2'-O)-methyltransferase